MQSSVAKQNRLDYSRTPECDAVRPTSPALSGVAALHGCSVKIEKRLLACDVLRDIELRYVLIDNVIGTAVISISASVPKDNDPSLIQHGERAVLCVGAHGDVH